MENGGGVVRRRPVAVPVGSAGFASTSTSDRARTGPRERTSRPHGWGLVVVLVVLFVALYACMYRLDRHLPPAGPLEHAAMRYLLPLMRLGPHPTGSPANEVQAVNILLDFLNGIKQNTRSLHRLEIDQQVVSGSYRMRSLNGVTSTYANVQNLVARLGPREGSNHSVMVNCHFDSAINSPGASDDLVSCSVMLEVLHLMSQQSEPLRHSVIFLFNGAEENMMQAAHGFITRHKWSRSIRAYINLEACGAGGRELVFQTGPGHPWLVKTYAESVPYPFANIIGQEVFQSGFIPSDTDFRIFRDHGHIPGLDTAFISNGYVYHTPYDNEQQLTAGSMQRAGENVLAMLRRLTSTDVIVNAETQDVGSVVFLDVFGMCMMVLPGWLNTLNAYLLSAIVCYSVFKSLRRQNMSVRHGAGGVVVLLTSWLAAAAVSWLLANILDYFNATMSWYSVRYWLVGIYVTATVGTAIVVQQTLIGFAVTKSGDAVLCESLLYESVRLLLVGPLLLLAYLNIQSSIALQLLLVFPTVTRSLVAQHVMRITSGWCHVMLHLVGQALPVAIIMYAFSFATELFVPMTGRIGTSLNPELLIGGLTLVCTLLITMYATPLMSLSRAGRRFGVALLLVSGICVATVAFTPFGFPYSTRRPDIRAQRVWIQHVERTFWADDGSVRLQDSGFLLSHQDRNGRVSGVDQLLGLHEPLHTEQFCQQLLYCGMPYYYPSIRSNYRNDYFLGPRPSFSTAVSYATTSERRADGLMRLHFNITGPDHMTMQLSPRPGVQLLTWSMADGVPLASVQFQFRPSYFLYFSWGKQPSPWVFWIDVDVSVDVSLLADAVINGHYLHGDDGRTSQLQTLVDKLPDWTVPVVFGSALHSFTVRL